MLDQHVDVAVAGGGLQAVQHVAVKGPQALFDKAAGLELKRTEVADGAQLSRQMHFDEITGRRGMRQEGFEGRIMWNGCHFHSESLKLISGRRRCRLGDHFFCSDFPRHKHQKTDPQGTANTEGRQHAREKDGIY